MTVNYTPIMATANIQIPSLNWSGTNQKLAFNEWKTLLLSYFAIANVDAKSQYHYILLSLGSKGHELLSTWELSATEKEDPSVVFKKFEEHLIGQQNKWVARMELNSIIQKEGELVEDFLCHLQSKAQCCLFSTDSIREEQITLQIIKGILWPDARRTLIARGNDLKMKDAVTIAQAHQAMLSNTKSFTSERIEVAVNEVNTRRRGRRRECRFCGTQHPPRQCPAYGKNCEACGGKNHAAEVCYSRRKKSSTKKSQSRRRNSKKRHDTAAEKAVHHTQVEEICDVLDCGELNICPVKVNDNDDRQSIFAKLNVKPPDVYKKVTLRVKADTGANGNILPLRCVKQMYENIPSLSQSSVTLRAVNGTILSHLGYIDMPVNFDNSEWYLTRFYVCDTTGPAILSCGMSEKLGIVKVSNSHSISYIEGESVDKNTIANLQTKFPECFAGIGRFPGNFHIELKENITPVIAAPRKYPIQLKGEIGAKLQEMENLGVIAKCDDSIASEWVNSLAFARKANGDLRICLDPKHLNEAIKRTYHKTPTLEEISHQLNGAQLFSKLDAKHGYWAIELDEKSSHLCTFQSPFGKYRFLRLPFGLSVSQDIFQKHMDDIIQKAGPGVIGIADDLVVFGQSVKEHDEALNRLMHVAKQYGLVFRSEKCKTHQTSISFYGLLWSKDGMQPDPRKCDEIHNRPAPHNVQELQSFLGLVQYLAPFVPQISEKTHILRQLCRKGVEWDWTAECEKAFVKLKNEFSADLQLRYFNPSQPVEIEVDASTKGLGAALIQNHKPIAFVSKALSGAETRYANIERELLAVVFGLERFHTYVYGKPVTILSDHKPLESIHLRQLSHCPPRLQRMLLRIQPYEATIRYRPGKEMVYADYLSRVTPTPGPEIPLEMTIHTIQISDNQLDKLRNAVKNDSELSALQEQIVIGWPDSVQSVVKCLRKYWSIRDYLCVENGIVYMGNRLVIPKEMRNYYLQQIHIGHLGQTKCQLRAKECLYWPNMSADIVNTVENCDICIQNARSQSREPMMVRELPSQPWEILHSDYFEIEGHKYMLVVDQYSKMPFVQAMKGETAGEAVKFCKHLFAIHGIPRIVYSDNGPQYSSVEFKSFTVEWDFKHITSSPRYPQSNGFVERMVGIVKGILKKAKQGGTDPQLALLCYRSTPIDNHIPSPAELLYGRKIRTNLPAKNYSKNSDYDISDRFHMKQNQAAEQYNQHAGKELPELIPGMKVMLQKDDKSSWIPVTVQAKCPEPRSYLVQTPNGSVIRRNRRFLQEVNDQVAHRLSCAEETKTLVNDEAPKQKKTVTFKDDTQVVRRSDRKSSKTQRYIEQC